MLRGVNRRIIEINECNSAYFERAIFIIRPDASNISDGALRGEADALIKKMWQPPSVRRRKYKISRRVLWLITLISLAAAVALALLYLL